MKTLSKSQIVIERQPKQAAIAASLTLDEDEMNVIRRLDKVGGISKLTKSDQRVIQHINGKIRRYNGLTRRMKAESKQQEKRS